MAGRLLFSSAVSIGRKQLGRNRVFSVSSNPYLISVSKRANLVFGANTDVGKTIVSAGLVRASLKRGGAAHYIKPLQCGGSDQAFVEKHVRDGEQDESRYRLLTAQTLFSWETPASPHTASMLENKPCSDAHVLSTLNTAMADISNSKGPSTTYIETAGGVLSPSAASPQNELPNHAKTTQKGNSDSQCWGWKAQGDLYQPILGKAPAVLVGDGRLGGISCTLSALESLVIRGYDIAAIVLLETTPDTSYGNNIDALRDYVATRAFQLRSGSGEALFPFPQQSMLSLPPIPVDPMEPLHDWYNSDQVREAFGRLDAYLQSSWEGQVYDLRSLLHSGERRQNAVWWPGGNTHAANGEQETVLVDSAVGDKLFVIQNGDMKDKSSTLQHTSLLDASASWWTHGVGRGESTMALAAAAAAGRYGHVSAASSGGVTHAPAVALAQMLVGSSGPGHKWADRVFFADDGGSAAMDTAIKMGIKTYQRRMKVSMEEAERLDWIVSTQEDCYHGDTLGTLNAAEPYLDREHPWYKEKSFCLETPSIGFKEGALKITFPDGTQPSDDDDREFESIEQVMDVDARKLTRMLPLYKELIEVHWLAHEHSARQQIGTVILEPVLLCAGGMKFVDPLWQRAVVEVARSRNIPVIFDESSVGLYRLGVKSCREILKIDPDIAVYSKLLTGGLVPLSATLVGEEVFNAFADDEVAQSLLNGNTFVAPAIACASALQALSVCNAEMKRKITGAGVGKKLATSIFFDESLVRNLSMLPSVTQSFTLGSVLSVQLHPYENEEDDNTVPSRADTVIRILKGERILAEGIGDIVYIMLSPLASQEDYSHVAGILYKTIEKLG